MRADSEGQYVEITFTELVLSLNTAVLSYILYNIFVQDCSHKGTHFSFHEVQMMNAYSFTCFDKSSKLGKRSMETKFASHVVKSG